MNNLLKLKTRKEFKEVAISEEMDDDDDVISLDTNQYQEDDFLVADENSGMKPPKYFPVI